MERTIRDHCQDAQRALDSIPSGINDNEEQLIDLLTNLKHWAINRDVSFTHCLSWAECHWHDEKKGGE